MAQSPNIPIKAVGVVGAGTMGHGIAQILISSGYSVVLYDLMERQLRTAGETISRGLAKDVEKGRLKAGAREQALGRLKTTTTLDDFAGVDFAIEAATEKFEVKSSIFSSLETGPLVARPEVIFASNTSSISITRLAASTRRPERFVGLHFFNPVPVMKLVEVIASFRTASETVETAVGLAVSLGKTPVRVKDSPGFVSNRVLMPMINEAVFCFMEGVSDAKGIDTVLKLGMDHPMGPLELADLIGLDVCLDIMTVLYEGFRDSKYRPCSLLEKMVAAGRLGRKTGSGFYEYPKEESK